MDDEKIQAEVLELIKNRRTCAFIPRPNNVRHTASQNSDDVHVVRRFLEAVKNLLSLGVDAKSVVSRGTNDPPDCEAYDEEKRKLGFEITELVDAEYIKGLKNQTFNPEKYSVQAFIGELESLLAKKKKRCFPDKLKGGPYYKLVLLIIINEPLLNFHFCKEVLRSHRFDKSEPLDLGFLCFPPAIPHGPLVNLHDLNYRTFPIYFCS